MTMERTTTTATTAVATGSGLWTVHDPPPSISSSEKKKKKKKRKEKNKNPSAQEDVSARWLESIQQAVHSVVSPHCGRSPDHAENKLQAEASLKYLLKLESILMKECEKPQLTEQQQQQRWNRPPKRGPPPVYRGEGGEEEEEGSTTTGSNIATPPSIRSSFQRQQQATPKSNDHQPVAVLSPSRFTNNRYAVFGDDDDESSSSSSNNDGDDNDENNGDDDDDDDDDDDSAGDIPVLHSVPMRRLRIRILTSQADVSSHLAFLSRQQSLQLYTFGAHACTVAVQKIYEALLLADTALSQWLNSNSGASAAAADTNSNSPAGQLDPVEYQHLVEDATIVGISVGHLVTERDNFLTFVQKEAARLLRKLEPQWQARDAIRSSWGDDKWRKNPRPKGDFAQQRQQDEQELRQVQEAEAVLQVLDTDALQWTSDDLKQRLDAHKNRRRQRLQQRGGGSGGGGSVTENQKPYRYNGLRPKNKDLALSTQDDYPDPTLFGWTFTGSNEVSRVEFFERNFEMNATTSSNNNNSGNDSSNQVVVVVVKLDWYYTTHTIKTALDHPVQGRTQLFASSDVVTPQLYRQILINPRQHTNVRYQTRDGKNYQYNNGHFRGGPGRGGVPSRGASRGGGGGGFGRGGGRGNGGRRGGGGRG